jgi:hypothetical protein
MACTLVEVGDEEGGEPLRWYRDSQIVNIQEAMSDAFL